VAEYERLQAASAAPTLPARARVTSVGSADTRERQHEGAGRRRAASGSRRPGSGAKRGQSKAAVFWRHRGAAGADGGRHRASDQDREAADLQHHAGRRRARRGRAGRLARAATRVSSWLPRRRRTSPAPHRRKSPGPRPLRHRRKLGRARPLTVGLDARRPSWPRRARATGRVVGVSEGDYLPYVRHTAISGLWTVPEPGDGARCGSSLPRARCRR
jgi:hypothetical protein